MAEPTLQDDQTITDSADLWRRIPPWHFVFDENSGEVRPSSAAFDNDPDGSPMSVLLADLMVELKKAPLDALSGHESFALAAITAGLARANGQAVVRDPLPDEPTHALVAGLKTKSVRRKLARGAQWVIAPDTSA